MAYPKLKTRAVFRKSSTVSGQHSASMWVSEHQCEHTTLQLPWYRGSEGWGTCPPGRASSVLADQGKQSRVKLEVGTALPRSMVACVYRRPYMDLCRSPSLAGYEVQIQEMRLKLTE